MADDKRAKPPAQKRRLRFRRKPSTGAAEPETTGEPGYSSHATVHPPPGPAMVDVPVHLILAAVHGRSQSTFVSGGQPGFQDHPGTAHEHQFALDEISLPAAFPLDQATSTTGRRVFEPFELFKATDATTPQFYRALTTGETLTTAIFDCFGLDKSGKTVLAASVTLTGAAVASIDFQMHRPKQQGGPSGRDRISLVFEKVEVSFASETFTGEWS